MSHHTDHPEVTGQLRIEEVGIGHVEVAIVALPGAPRVSAEAPSVGIVIADRHDRMADDGAIVIGRQGDDDLLFCRAPEKSCRKR